MDTANHSIDDQQPDDQQDEAQKKPAPAWLISVGVHALAVAVMASVVFVTTTEQERELPPIPITVLPDPPKTVQEKPKTPFEKVDLEIPVEQKSDVATPVTPLIETDVVTTTDNDQKDDGQQGRIDAASTSEEGAAGAFTNIGAGGGGSGQFGNRKGSDKRRVSRHWDPSCIRGPSVENALRWFTRHQSPNGMWDVDGYQANCMDGTPKCEPGKEQAGNADIACTGYALLCYFGAGYDQNTPSRYRQTIIKGIDYLLANQQANGLFGERNYEHAVATTALAEALAMSKDARLQVPAQKAVDVMLSRQARDPTAKDAAYAGLGWDYVEANPARIDSSVTGWNVMALKSALAAGLKVGNGLAGGKAWLERTWKARNPEWQKLDPYTSESYFPYVYDATSGTVSGNGAGDGHLACVGALCAVFLGHHAGDPMLETLSNYIMKHDFPTAYPINTYFLYYNTLAMFQVGGERWERWNQSVATMLADAQRKDDGCFNGSWDYEGTKFHGHDTGRLLSTAYACLSQEVIWRYAQVGDGKAKR